MNARHRRAAVCAMSERIDGNTTFRRESHTYHCYPRQWNVRCRHYYLGWAGQKWVVHLCPDDYEESEQKEANKTERTDNWTKSRERRTRTSSAGMGSHGRGGRGHIVGKSEGSQRTAGADGGTGRGSKAGRSRVGENRCIRCRWWRREIGFGGKERRVWLSYNGRWRSGVQGSFVGLVERRGAVCCPRCSVFEL